MVRRSEKKMAGDGPVGSRVLYTGPLSGVPSWYTCVLQTGNMLFATSERDWVYLSPYHQRLTGVVAGFAYMGCASRGVTVTLDYVPQIPQLSSDQPAISDHLGLEWTKWPNSLIILSNQALRMLFVK